jgi:outer membrane lipoprotein carrier protein
MKRVALFLILTGAVLLSAPPADGQSPAVRQVVQNLEKAIASTRTLRAEFTQLHFAAAVADPLIESGELLFAKPDLMRWEYSRPEPKVFLVKDGLFEMYIPAEKQLVRSRVPAEAYRSDIIGILLGTRSILEAYSVEAVSFPTNNTGVRQLKLTPREEGEFSHLLLEVDGRTWLLRRAIFMEWAGNKREYVFRKIRLNSSLPAGTFSLKVPDDVEVIEDRRPRFP